MHLCRGNQAGRWLVEGGYDWLAERLFPRVSAERLLLEYDDERSGSFEPLRAVPEGKIAVLGLVTTKSGRRETVDELAGAHRGGKRVLPARAARAVSAVRLRHFGSRQRPDRRGRAGEARDDRRRRLRWSGVDDRPYGDRPDARGGRAGRARRRAGRACGRGAREDARVARRRRGGARKGASRSTASRPGWGCASASRSRKSRRISTGS